MGVISVSQEIFNDVKFNVNLYNELIKSLEDEIGKGNEIEIYEVYIEGQTTRKKFGRYKFSTLQAFQKWLP